MLPQQAKVSLLSIPQQPNLDVSMTLNITTMFGRNKVNRVAHSTANFYSGAAQSDKTIELQVAGVDPQTNLPIPSSYASALVSPSKIIQIVVTRPITVQVTINSVVQTLQVNKLLVIDSEVTNINLLNSDTQNSVQVILSYLS
jgi:hypothetical protein